MHVDLDELIRWMEEKMNEGFDMVDDYKDAHGRWVDGWKTGAVWMYSQLLVYKYCEGKESGGEL